MVIITDPRCTEYSSRGHPERPDRVLRTVALLDTQHQLKFTWAETAPVTDVDILRAHTEDHLRNIQRPGAPFDDDTPAYPDIAHHARRSVGGALRAMQGAAKGEIAFSLMRPPGHHATPDKAMGFCYFNSIAIAALAAQQMGYKRVTVFDFDVHHGNGTEDILVDRSDCTFISVHQSPCYPGTGLADRGKNCFNFPVPPEMPRAHYREVLSTALLKLKESKPDMIAVSAGFDAFSGDPLAAGTLEPEDFHWLGQSIRALNIPAFSILEGGYSTSLPQLILAYLTGLNA